MTAVFSRLRQLLSVTRNNAVHTYRVSKTSQPEGIDDLLASTALYVVSPGRSGTKSLVDFCARNTSMYCVHAPTPWLASVGYAYHRGKIPTDGARYAFYAAREPYLIDAYQNQRVFFDGDCKNLPLTLQIAELMPNARFIHLVRDPAKFIRSGLARGYYRSTPHELWGHLTSGDYMRNPDIPFEEQTARIAYFWNEANRVAEDAKKTLGSDRIVTLVAETMFQSPTEILATLRKLGLDEVVNAGADLVLKRLNARAPGTPLSGSSAAIIDKAVADICDTRALYYD